MVLGGVAIQGSRFFQGLREYGLNGILAVRPDQPIGACRILKPISKLRNVNTALADIARSFAGHVLKHSEPIIRLR